MYNRKYKYEIKFRAKSEKGTIIMRKNLIDARKKNSYTQKELAQLINLSERQYQSLEAGTSDGSIKTWQKLKAILHAETIDFLLEQEDSHISR